MPRHFDAAQGLGFAKICPTNWQNMLPQTSGTHQATFFFEVNGVFGWAHTFFWGPQIIYRTSAGVWKPKETSLNLS